MIVIGRHSAELSRSYSYDRQRGRRSSVVYTGTRDACNGLSANLINIDPNLEWDIEPVDAPLYRLNIREPDVTDGSQPEKTVTWELLANAVQKDVFESPKALALAPTYINDLHDYFDRGKEPKLWMLIGVASPELIAATPPDAYAIFNLLSADVRHYQSDNHVLRKTQIVAEGTNIELGFERTGYLFRTNQLTPLQDYDIGIPSDILFSIAAIQPPVAAATGYAWTWLKRSPQVEQVSGNKWRITDEWWLEYWSTFLYKLAVPPNPQKNPLVIG